MPPSIPFEPFEPPDSDSDEYHNNMIENDEEINNETLHMCSSITLPSSNHLLTNNNTGTFMTENFNTISGEKLRSIISRIESLEDDKTNVLSDIKEVYAEAKGIGFDSKIIRKVVQLRKIDSQKLQEEENILELYKSALNM